MRVRPLVVGSAMSAILLAAFYELAEDFAGSSTVIAFDTRVLSLVRSWRPDGLTDIMKWITAAGSTPAVIVAALTLLVALLLSRRPGDALFSTLVVSAGGMLSWVAKGSFARSRPPAEEALIPLPLSFSFPSGHTMGSFCLACVVIYLAVRSRWAMPAKALVVIVALAYALAVGYSRIYLGVHWPSDVVAGWLLGGAIASAATGAKESLRQRAA